MSARARCWANVQARYAACIHGQPLPPLVYGDDVKIESIGEPIAQRTLTADKAPILVTIGKPLLYEGGPDYYCPYSIECFGEKKLSYGAGADAIQALQLAMKKSASIWKV